MSPGKAFKTLTLKRTQMSLREVYLVDPPLTPTSKMSTATCCGTGAEVRVRGKREHSKCQPEAQRRHWSVVLFHFQRLALSCFYCFISAFILFTFSSLSSFKCVNLLFHTRAIFISVALTLVFLLLFVCFCHLLYVIYLLHFLCNYSLFLSIFMLLVSP